MPNFFLTTQQRALVALTAWHLKLCSLRQALNLYRVTAADLRATRREWKRLQAERAAETPAGRWTTP